MNRRITTAYVATAMGVWVNVALVASIFADTKVVDPSGHGDYTAIQAAVSDLPNPGPRTIIVRAGTYNEAVSLSARNTQATNDSQRIIIMADTNTAPNLVVVTPPSGSSGMSLNQSRFITLQGLVITGVEGKNVPAVRLDGGSEDNEDIAIVGCQIHHNAGQGIQVLSNNPRTWIMNNLIHDSGRNNKNGDGVAIADGVGATVYVVNNTIVRNKSDGVFVDVPRPLYLVNNLIVGNGRSGFERASGLGDPTAVTLLYNLFYANTAGDIANASQTLDATDSGNRTTAGNQGIGVVGCTFPNCRRTAPLAALFVNPGAVGADSHLAAGSPAIDRGVNTFADGTTTWILVDDIEGHPRPQDGDGDCFTIADVGCYEAPAIPCEVDAVPPLARFLLGDGSGLISNVNANTLGGIPAAGFATTSGSYANMNVGTATFAATAGNALNLGNIPPGGYVRTNDARVANAITALYATGGGSVTVSGNAGTIEFASGGWGGTNLWLLNGGPVLTNDELEIVTAGELTGSLSNYANHVQLTLSNSTNAASAPAQSLSNVLAVGNISGTGIVMSAKDSTTSHGFLFVDGSGLTNPLFALGSNVVHIAPSGATGAVWDAINLPYPANTNGNYLNMSVGTATFAAGAGSAMFADSTGTSTNALQLGGIVASSYYKSGDSPAFADVTAAGTGTFGKIRSDTGNGGFDISSDGYGILTVVELDANYAQIGDLGGLILFINPSAIQTFNPVSGGNTFDDGSGNAHFSANVTTTGTGTFGNISASGHFSDSVAQTFTYAAHNFLAQNSGFQEPGLCNWYIGDNGDAFFALGVNYAAGAGTATFATSSGYATNAGSAPAQPLSDVLVAGNISGTGIVMSAKNSTTSHELLFIDGNGNTNQILGSVSNLMHVAPAGATGTVWDALNLPYPASTNGSYAGMNVGTATFAAGAGAATFSVLSSYATNASAATSAGTATFATSSGYATNAESATSATFATSALTATNCVNCLTNGSSPIFAQITDNGLTASQMVKSDGSKQLVSATANTDYVPPISYTTYTPGTNDTVALDSSAFRVHEITLPAGNIALAVTNAAHGRLVFVRIKQDATGGRTVTWFSGISWVGGSVPVLTTTGNKSDMFGIYCTETNTFDGFAIGFNL